MQKPIRSKTVIKEEREEDVAAAVQNREEVQSLLHIKERDFSSLRDRHRRLRERIRQRDRAEATTTTTSTTTSRPRTPLVAERGRDEVSSLLHLADRPGAGSGGRGALLHRNRQDTLSRNREREELLERLNRNR